MIGTYRVPYWGGFMMSGVYRYMTGQAWEDTAIVTGFAQGTQRIRIEPQGTRRLPAINKMDFRIEKTMPLPRLSTTLGLFADVFNIWNQGVPNSDAGDAVNANSGARFGQPYRVDRSTHVAFRDQSLVLGFGTTIPIPRRGLLVYRVIGHSSVLDGSLPSKELVPWRRRSRLRNEGEAGEENAGNNNSQENCKEESGQARDREAQNCASPCHPMVRVRYRQLPGRRGDQHVGVEESVQLRRFLLRCALPHDRDIQDLEGQVPASESIGLGLAIVYVGLQQNGCGQAKTVAREGDRARPGHGHEIHRRRIPERRDCFSRRGALQRDPVSADGGYIRGWVSAILDSGKVKAGIYCPTSKANEIRAAARKEYAAHALPGGSPVFWAVKVDPHFDRATSTPGGSGVSDASVWQGRLDINETHGGVTIKIDQNVADSRNPSNA
jgi:hypothetical protein